MQPLLPNCCATGIGSTPYTDPSTAVNFVLQTFPHVPFWPQLPKRTWRENMYVQFSEHLPGMRTEEDGRVWIGLNTAPWLEEAERFYEVFLQETPEPFAPSPEHAAGLYELLRRGPLEGVWAVKGQVTGPISFGLHVCDQDMRPSLYDEMMYDIIVKNTLRHAQWQEARLRALHRHTIIFVDEPYLSMIGSAYASLSRQQVIAALEEVFSSLQGLKGVHCCANTDWSMLLGTSVDILSFDAYEYAEYIMLYPDDLRAFLARGGMLAWGVIPSTGEAAKRMALDEAWETLERALILFERKGFDRRTLLPRSFITPACGTGTLPVPVAERVMQLAHSLSERIREEYRLE